MTTQTNWMIAAAGTDAIQAREAGFTCLHLCARQLGISQVQVSRLERKAIEQMRAIMTTDH